MRRKRWSVLLLLVLLGVSVGIQDAAACGGLFCQNIPVDQNAERIIFTDNGDGTISAYIQIQYTGSAPDFSWILPLPTPITAEDLEAPEDAMAAFTELETLTNPVFIPPPFPDCAEEVFDDMAVQEGAIPSAGGVEIFATGEVGPFGFDVIGSEDPSALITWLRTNQYTVTEQMEPLINVYVAEKFVFLAMRLLPESTVQDIQPIKITYATSKPMIPLRLTAVAANPDMAVIVWFYGSSQYVPENYTHMEIKDEDITFFTFGGHDYRALMGRTADSFNGQAFVTEYAAPANLLTVTHPLLLDLSQKHAYLTRLNTVISPEEMTLDPVFKYDPSRADVSNIHDLSGMTGLYDCERESSGLGINLPFLGNTNESGSGSGAQAGATNYTIPALVLFSVCLFGVVGGGLVVFGLMRLRRR
ncbi:MAG: DUF2330 domain-containing protein [Chloroflexi bacterium]|nr:DUF2330 domain-containing protein [Chloroflexota bacterium]MBP8055033.1 DUF2330 domain-containing protein [Chloroflexota bacterium]